LGGAATAVAALRHRTGLPRRARPVPPPRRVRTPPRPSHPAAPGPEPMIDRPLRPGFVVNDVGTEKDNYTTIRLARTAINGGHSVALIGLEDFIYDPSGVVHARAHLPRRDAYDDDAALLGDLHDDDARVERINVEELDVLMLRSDPAEEAVDRP